MSCEAPACEAPPTLQKAPPQGAADPAKGAADPAKGAADPAKGAADLQRRPADAGQRPRRHFREVKHTEEQLKASDNLSGAEYAGLGQKKNSSENPDVAKKSGGAGALKIIIPFVDACIVMQSRVLHTRYRRLGMKTEIS